MGLIRHTKIDWSPITKEHTATGAQSAYTVAKKYAAQALWEWAEAHPHIDVTTSMCFSYPLQK